MSLISSQFVPAQRLFVVLRNALPGGVHQAEVVLRGSMSLISSQLVPAHRLFIVLRNSQIRVTIDVRAVWNVIVEARVL